MKNRVILIAVLGAAAIGAAFYVRGARQGELAEQERANVNDMLTSADGYANHKAFLDAEADGAHQAAEAAAFDGAAIGQATFDPQKYSSVYMNRLIERARAEKKNDLVDWLKGLCFEANIPVTS